MDISFFTASKLIWLLLQPGHLLLLLLALAVLLLFTRHARRGRRLLVVLMVLLLGLWGFSLGDALLQPLESRFAANPDLPEQLDGIIVLGGSVLAETSHYWQQLETNDAAERLGYFLILAKHYPEARLLFTGGSTSLTPGRPTEADQLGTLLEATGLEQRVVLDRQARNTAENAVEARNLMQPRPGENWLLITTAFHMPRAVGVFCRLGWPVIPYPVDHRSLPGQWKRFRPDLSAHLQKLETAVHEWLGLLAYRVTGRIPSLLPGVCAGDTVS